MKIQINYSMNMNYEFMTEAMAVASLVEQSQGPQTLASFRREFQG
jgi:hypothetical protein